MTDWVDRGDHDPSDDDFSDDEPSAAPGEGSIYNVPAAFFASMGVSNPILPIPVLKKPKEVREETRERSRKIGSSYKSLRDTVERHETTIQRRWANKTKQQKRFPHRLAHDAGRPPARLPGSPEGVARPAGFRH